MDDVVIRKASPEDIESFYTDCPFTIEAWVAIYKGKPAAIAGIRFNEYGMVVFSEMKDVKAPKMLAFKTALKMMERIKDTGLPVITVALETEPKQYSEKSARFLELMGFKFSHWSEGFAVFRLR